MAPPASALRAIAVVLVFGAAALVAPFAAPLVLAAWLADVLRPIQHSLQRAFRSDGWAAATLVVLVVFLVLLPLAAAALALVPRLLELGEQVRAVLQGKESFRSAVLVGGDAPGDLTRLTTEYGESMWRAVSAVARASATAAISAVVFVAALYTFLADGGRAYGWLEAHAPMPGDAFDRLAGAFRETGRGLLIAGGGTALLQGLVATMAYLAIGIPRAVVLGLLTAACTLVPAVGTAVVWVPLAIDLAFSGEYLRAVLMACAGVVIGVVDNVVRPALARYGRLALPTFVVLVSMLGGVTVLGPAGALLGPLVVRLAVEAVEVLRRATPTDPSLDAGPREL